jgi:hypothetical protein
VLTLQWLPGALFVPVGRLPAPAATVRASSLNAFLQRIELAGQVQVPQIIGDRARRPDDLWRHAVRDRRSCVREPEPFPEPADEISGAQTHQFGPPGRCVHTDPITRIQHAPQLAVDADGDLT